MVLGSVQRAQKTEPIRPLTNSLPMQRTLIALSLSLIFAGCDSGTSSTANQTLRLSFSTLDALTNGFHYEGWAIIGGNPVSTGKFNVDANGDIVDLAGSPISNGDFNTGEDLSTASVIVITIEPSGDTDDIPSSTKYLGGDVASLATSLSPAHGSSLGNTYASSAGSYILTTPTDDPAAHDLSGIWFLDNSSGSPVAGLTLPTLPEGWAYEGWAVINGSPVTTGTFTAVDAADDAAPFSGPNAGPPFPGEDFLVNAPAGQTFPTDLSGGTAVISIEPFPDDDAAPFTLKPLTGAIPVGAASGTVYSLTNNSAAFPTGSASIR